MCVCFSITQYIAMKKVLKNIIRNNYTCYRWFLKINGIRNVFAKRPSNSKNTLINNGFAFLKKDIIGSGNTILIDEGAFLKNVHIKINGNNNTLHFEKGCQIGEDCSFWMQGNNINIIIGEQTSMTCRVHLNAGEDNSQILVGKRCMFANTIIIRTSDDHPIYDINTNERINPAKNVIIGNHVWICPNVTIMKGAKIGQGAVIGSSSMVTHEIPENCLAVGYPAKVIKENIRWDMHGAIRKVGHLSQNL